MRHCVKKQTPSTSDFNWPWVKGVNGFFEPHTYLSQPPVAGVKGDFSAWHANHHKLSDGKINQVIKRNPDSPSML